jgi:dephospho-CoA kinase
LRTLQNAFPSYSEEELIKFSYDWKRRGYVEVANGNGLELTPQNVGKVMLQLRAEGGNYVIAQKCIPRIEEQSSNKVLVDGLRSLFEAEIFRKNFAKFSLVGVHASPETRFNRLFKRQRSDDPPNFSVFKLDNPRLNKTSLNRNITDWTGGLSCSFKSTASPDFSRSKIPPYP